ncbi:UBP1-associated proteins 1C [Malania oleifera]|uniref:UBP1-associated proteins 1C n=1 Tax=Malania oleifera TaxID=397392 RepID=UPI0025ADDF67|nr:UBP1-associated proteins 1C [Malania oleifera]
MVWFQCEDCGENLKKPKLPNHFRICPANKLSCIDCGKIFGQQSVQGHTQCVTEAEKYGPKGQGKALNGTIAKPNDDPKKKQKPDVDINVGLSERPPWFCSLCNTSATSRQSLLLHAEGKKHRAKARAFHAAKEQPKHTEACPPDTNIANENTPKGELLSSKDVEAPKEQDLTKDGFVEKSSEAENGSLSLKKKRKLDASENDGARKKTGVDTLGSLGNGKAIQIERAGAKETDCHVKKAKHGVPKEDKVAESTPDKDGTKRKINWKKLITSVLKSNPDGALKMRRLRKLVLKALRESGITEDENQLNERLQHKITSSSRFTVVDKYVHLVATD